LSHPTFGCVIHLCVSANQFQIAGLKSPSPRVATAKSAACAPTSDFRACVLCAGRSAHGAWTGSVRGRGLPPDQDTQAPVAAVAVPCASNVPALTASPMRMAMPAPSISDPLTVISRVPTVSVVQINRERDNAAHWKRRKGQCHLILSPSCTSLTPSTLSVPDTNSHGWNTSTPAPSPVMSKIKLDGDPARSIVRSNGPVAQAATLVMVKRSFGAPSRKVTVTSAAAEVARNVIRADGRMRVFGLRLIFHKVSPLGRKGKRAAGFPTAPLLVYRDA
jgi:hypothetical protein